MTYATIAVERFVNELNENNGRTGINVDPIADIYIFDTASILLFRSKRVQRFFSHTLHGAVWGKQPSFIIGSGELHNVGQYYSFKLKPSVWNRTSLFYHVGMGLMVGLSRELENQYAFSVGAGIKTSKLREVDEKTGLYTIEKAETVGLFLDRENSLLASLQVSHNAKKVIELNIYPGILPIPGTGFWMSRSRDGIFHMGLTTRIGIGTGVKIN